MHSFFSRFLPQSRKEYLRAVIMLLPVVLFFATGSAWADNDHEVGDSAATSFGSVLCNAYDSVFSLNKLFRWFSILAAGYFCIRGLIELKDRADNPQQHPLHKALTYFIVATLLLSIMPFIAMLMNSFFGTPGPGHTVACSGIGADGAKAGTNVGLDVMMTNLITDIKKPMEYLLGLSAEMVGFFFIVRGLTRATKVGSDAKTSLTNIYTSFIIGAILCAVGSSFSMLLGSLFGATSTTASSSLLEWAAFKNNGTSTQFASAVQAALTFFQLIGFISFIRGWTILRQAVEGHGQHTISQGLTHILGGVIACNIYGFLPLLDKTFGSGFIS